MKKILTIVTVMTLLSPIAKAQEDVTVSLTPGYAFQSWYKLSNDAVISTALSNWDLAFEISGFTASILVNTANGDLLYKYPGTASDANFLAMDTTGYAGWPVQYNSDTSWSYGAFNQQFSNEYDLDWGIYDPVTHFIIGDSLYLVKLADGSLKKLWIQSLATGSYTFRFANPDNSGDMTVSIAKADFANKNFAYYSLSNMITLDPEPWSIDWDLLFTKYTTTVYMPDPVPYSVTGILSNKGVYVAKAEDVDVTSDEFAGFPFNTAINTIGYDWKEYDFGTNTWLIQEDLAYFVETLNGDIWKLIFTGFGGSATGDVEFTKELIESGVAIAGPENTVGSLVANPNPANAASGTTAIISLDAATTGVCLQVLDLAGRNVQTLPLGDLAEGLYPVQIETSDLSGGVYLLQIIADGMLTAQSKLVIL